MILHAVTGKRIHFDKKTSKKHIFAHVKESLRKQGRLSRPGGIGSGCWYRNPKLETKCAVGVLIDDREYTPKIDGRWFVQLPTNFGVKKLNPNVQSMLARLQLMHDNARDFDDLMKQLYEFVP